MEGFCTTVATVTEWVTKAEDDYRAAAALKRRRAKPLYDAVCFHCQQCAEKYLKAYLVSQGVAPAKIHDLEALVREGMAHDVRLSVFVAASARLAQYAVIFRYPGRSAAEADATEAMADVRRIRRAIRRRLGL